MFKTVSQRILNEVNVINVAKKAPAPKLPLKQRIPLWLKKQFIEFCGTTPLHGYNQSVSDFMYFLERIFWRLITIIATMVALSMLYMSWQYNSRTPTITVIESTYYPTYNIPFPAVTICNTNKISLKKAMEVAEAMRKPENMNTVDLAERFKLLLHFKGAKMVPNAKYMELHDILVSNRMSVDGLLGKIAPSCTDMLERCSWKGNTERCDNLFQPLNSSEGICCSFNSYAFKIKNYDAKIIGNIPKQPRRVTACGYKTGLSVLLNPNTADYFVSDVGINGFKVFLHRPWDFSDQDATTKFVSVKSETFIMLAGIENKYITDDGLKLPPKERNCVLSDERSLSTLSIYTYVNCMAECRVKALLDACGCVPYFLPNNGSLPMCKMSQILCVKRNKHLYGAGLSPDLSIPNGAGEEKKDMELKCDCDPDCEINFFPAEITSGPLDRTFSINSLSFFKDVNLTDQSLVHVFYTDLTATRYRQDMFQNWLGVLAAFGGVLGLFLGFSIVAAWELLYFYTLRPLFDKLKKKNEAVERSQKGVQTPSTSQSALSLKQIQLR